MKCSSPAGRLAGSNWWQYRRPTTLSWSSVRVATIQICWRRRRPTSPDAEEAMFSSYLATSLTWGELQQIVTAAVDVDEDDGDDITLSTWITTCCGSAMNQSKINIKAALLTYWSVSRYCEETIPFLNSNSRRFNSRHLSLCPFSLKLLNIVIATLTLSPILYYIIIGVICPVRDKCCRE